MCPSGNERGFVEKLPLKYLWGAGKKTIDKLNSFGYSTIGDVASGPRSDLEKIFGKQGVNLWHLATGIDDRPVQNTGSRKSISEENTFNQDVASDNYIEHILFRISDRLTRKMRNLGIKGKTISIKIRLQDFDTYTRSRTLETPVSDMQTVRATALELYRQFSRAGRKVRLVGISVSNLDTGRPEDVEQFELFREESVQRNERDVDTFAALKSSGRDDLLDEMKRMYGEKITRAAFLKNPSEKEYPES